ncbi:hypothetical protein [Patiriisocius marinus]|uniref:Lipoprotein n=1 Tax=Patiriisocius marinus TaxID=1397112 RepID=A0A5J4J108_9FLAO|nr:hypothetical protein [Patiriisocius marinus]GER60552.1 hypothetical protein ULMA_26600 [Patiriisocius marinus]
MKFKNTLLLVILGSMLLAGCQTENLEVNENTVDLTTQIGISAKEQTPNQLFDSTSQGIYHGVVASKTSQLRGKIWVNLGNNTAYTATIELINGTTETFTGVQNVKATKQNRYTFSGANSSFTVVEGDTNEFEINDLQLFQENYHAYIIKSRSNKVAISYTGTFSDTTNPGFSGTWNILANGDLNPNNLSGTTISVVMVTFGNTMFTDTAMEQGSSSCLATPWIPIVNLLGLADEGVLAFNQQSNFNGTVNWDLGQSNLIFGIEYMNSSCSSVSGGTFSWTHETSGITRIGQILID